GTVIDNANNSGTIEADISGGTLTFTGTVINQGVLRTSAGGILEFDSTVLNLASVDFSGGTVIFHGLYLNATGTTNSWQVPNGGAWEQSANWSRNVPPSPDDAAALITNSTAKTITISASTFIAAPSSVT